MTTWHQLARRIIVSAGATLAAAAASAIVTVAQPQAPVEFERSRSASRYGAVSNETIALSPLAAGPGRVFLQPLPYDGSVRLHFVIGAPPANGGWELRILDGDDVRWTTTADEESGPSFWSEEVTGDRLMIEVRTTSASAGFVVTIDKIALAAPRVVPQATTPPRDCKTPVKSMAPPQGCHAIDADTATRVRSSEPAVARLRLVADDGFEYFCSGFLIASDLLLTNWHCVQSIEEMNATRVDFDYDDATVKPLTLRIKDRVIPSAKSALDFVVLRLRKSPNRPPLRLADTAASAQSLVVIQHPDGEPAHVSVEDCRVTNPELPGADPEQKTDFGHFCDTSGGSSGSAVQDERTGQVIGLHHLGFRRNSNKPVNQAVMMKRILDAIGAERPDVLKEIMTAAQ